ncbi:hypothetical protein DIU31_027320 [Mucilaginibacter rubeus]|jgi:hypothetical protein|uniref:Uncharacterized protein n=1 Tax=Mucilaginibacter rubeus TaxID=2027860 RepID=A0AAE6JM21_9SPHI|nr:MULTISPECIES: hypothetical protein [Mucilaginibacter]PMP66338.1 MAG: hypothetical protein C0191_00670 [Mucilaginibacter sp.]HEK21026.1 hypothetical protein [Bacteroidota bacterium]NHA05648.1 hypothetical protein [Mucilaginibacter inviolabilis]QEM07037.1 hypothetical protein DIU31_027320 [Mucilaginibacter rubeus]QTE35451.1 hypothetical protein J3L18_20165 [Mucilaginibacter gossypii]
MIKIFNLFKKSKAETRVDIDFCSSSYRRYQNKQIVIGPQSDSSGCHTKNTVIRVKTNMPTNPGYSVFIEKSDEHTTGDTSVMPIPMSIVHANKYITVLKGFGVHPNGSRYLDYGLTVRWTDQRIEKIIFHLHDRDVNIEFSK